MILRLRPAAISRRLLIFTILTVNNYCAQRNPRRPNVVIPTAGGYNDGNQSLSKSETRHEREDRPTMFLARGVLGAAGVGAAFASIEEQTLLAATNSGDARPRSSAKPKTDIPPGSLPCGKIGNVSVSRLMIGGNLIGGWAHSRDLMYASKLFTSYNTEAKVFETLELAQACGINTIQIDPHVLGAISKYNRQSHRQDPNHGLHSAHPRTRPRMNDVDQAPRRRRGHA